MADDLWDGRFRVRLQGPAPAEAVVAALGYGGLRALEAAADPPPWLGAAPRQALASLPALWFGTELLASPTFSAPPGGLSRFATGLDGGRLASLRLRAAFQPRRPIAPAASC